ncbi:MAG: hypothetical protein WC473_04145 [Patescibacteria group bacterium]|jgi:hypothetical protein
MHKSFERTLIGPYRDIAREQMQQSREPEVTSKDKAELEMVLNWHLENRAKQSSLERGTVKGKQKTLSNQREIFEIQKKKQKLVE